MCEMIIKSENEAETLITRKLIFRELIREFHLYILAQPGVVRIFIRYLIIQPL